MRAIIAGLFGKNTIEIVQKLDSVFANPYIYLFVRVHCIASMTYAHVNNLERDLSKLPFSSSPFRSRVIEIVNF